MTEPSGENEAKPESPAEAAPSSDASAGDPAPPAATNPAATSPAAEDPTAQLRAERDKARDAMLRALADLDNYRKRARREADDAAKKAREDLLRELLPVFDNLDRAVQYVESGADPKAVGKGIEMVLRLFEDTLARIGGKRIRAAGQPFDPSQHEAIQQIETAEFPAGTVAREEVAGYVLNDRLLRPAMVVVSKGSPAASSGGGPDDASGSGGGSSPPS